QLPAVFGLQRDAAAGAVRELAVELRADAELALDLLRLGSRRGFGGVALGEDGVAAGVDDVAGDSVRLADGGDAHLEALLRPALPGALHARLVLEAQLLELHPGGADAGRSL